MSVYDVQLGEQVIGCVTLTARGLYYSLSCQCSETKEMVKLVVHSDLGEIPVGICAPTDSGFGIDRMIPQKRLGKGPFKFCLMKSDSGEGEFFSLHPDQPFQAIDRLEDARFFVKDGIPGILIKGDSDRNP